MSREVGCWSEKQRPDPVQVCVHGCVCACVLCIQVLNLWHLRCSSCSKHPSPHCEHNCECLTSHGCSHPACPRFLNKSHRRAKLVHFHFRLQNFVLKGQRPNYCRSLLACKPPSPRMHLRHRRTRCPKFRCTLPRRGNIRPFYKPQAWLCQLFYLRRNLHILQNIYMYTCTFVWICTCIRFYEFRSYMYIHKKVINWCGSHLGKLPNKSSLYNYVHMNRCPQVCIHTICISTIINSIWTQIQKNRASKASSKVTKPSLMK